MILVNRPEPGPARRKRGTFDEEVRIRSLVAGLRMN